MSWFSNLGLFSIILIRWTFALFEYSTQAPANRIGFIENGNPFNNWQLKVVQDVITLVVFIVVILFFFKEESFKTNHFIGFGFLILAAHFTF